MKPEENYGAGGNLREESLSAITAEMTDFCSGWSEDVDVTVKVGLIYGWACRLKEAAEREKRPGNAAAMRKALKSAHRTLKLVCEHAGEFVQPRLAEEIIHSGAAVERALDAPARNCDRFQTAEEAYAAWQRLPNLASAFAWLFAPAEGGAE